MASPAERHERFNALVEDYDPKSLPKTIDWGEHRFVSVERDTVTGDHFVKGHKTLRGACGHLGRTIEEGDPFVPELVYDLDTGDRHELDLFAFVAPRAYEAVPLLAPRFLMLRLRNIVMDDQELVKLIDRALERRRQA